MHYLLPMLHYFDIDTSATLLRCNPTLDITFILLFNIKYRETHTHTHVRALHIPWTIWFERKRPNPFPFPFYIYARLFVSRTDFYGYCTMIESIIEIQKETPQDIPISGASFQSYGIACPHVCLRISAKRGTVLLGVNNLCLFEHLFILAALKDATLYTTLINQYKISYSNVTFMIC